MKKFSSNWRKVASNLSNVRKTADYQADAESRGIIIQEEGSSTPTKGRKFEAMSSNANISVKDDISGQKNDTSKNKPNKSAGLSFPNQADSNNNVISYENHSNSESKVIRGISDKKVSSGSRRVNPPSNLGQHVNQREKIACSVCNIQAEMLSSMANVGNELANQNGSSARCILCMHCEGIYCNLCLKDHAKVLGNQLDKIVEELRGIKATRNEIGERIKLRYTESRSNILNIEKEKIESITEMKNKAFEDLKRRQQEEEKNLVNMQEGLKKIIEDATSIEGDGFENMDMIQHFTVIHRAYQNVVKMSKQLSNDKQNFVIDRSDFKIVNAVTPNDHQNQVTRADSSGKLRPKLHRKVSNNRINSFRDSGSSRYGLQVQAAHMLSKRHKITIHKTKPSCADFCPWTQQLWVCLPNQKLIEIHDTSRGLQVDAIELYDLEYPYKISFCPETEEVFILDQWKCTVYVLKESAKSGKGESKKLQLGSYQIDRNVGSRGVNLGQLMQPHGIATLSPSVSGENGYQLIIADTGNNRVQVIDAISGQFSRLIGGTIKGEKSRRPDIFSELKEPEDVAIYSKGCQLAVADTGNNRIRIYSLKTGDPLHIIGMKGTDNGQFLQPITVCFLQMTLGGTATAAKSNEPSKDDHTKSIPILAVGDSNNRLQLFTTDGIFLRDVSSGSGGNTTSGISCIRIFADDESSIVATRAKPNSVMAFM